MDYPLFLEAAHNPDARGAHSKFFGKGPAKIALPFAYDIKEVFVTTNKRNTLRGMHFQIPGQPKLIQVISGSIAGNLLCCNPESSSFGDIQSFSLDESAGRILVPGNWALGYRSLEDDTKVLYLAGADFVPGGDTGIDPFDPKLDLYWGENFAKSDAIISEKDENLQSFDEFQELVLP